MRDAEGLCLEGAMPGPAPSRNARRRNIRPDWRALPLAGRSGDAPDWPMLEPTVAELALWVELWRTPQAVAWFELGWSRVVARYVRLLILSESDSDSPAYAGVALLGEVRQLEDRLGLTPLAMRRLQWEMESAPQVVSEPTENVVSLFG